MSAYTRAWSILSILVLVSQTARVPLNAALDGKNVRVQAFVSELPKKDERDFSILELLSFVSSVNGSFAQPGPKAVRVGYHLDVEEAAQPVVAFTLTGG